MQVEVIRRSLCAIMGNGIDNENPERIKWLNFVGVQIANLPLPTIAPTGGMIGDAKISEARATLEGLKNIGYCYRNIVLEENSKTTRENIINLKPIIFFWKNEIPSNPDGELVYYSHGVHIFCDLLRQQRVVWLARKHFAFIPGVWIETHGFQFDRTDWERFRERVSFQIEKANYHLPWIANSLEIIRKPSLLRKFD